MTSRYLPNSTARRIKSITPVIRASSSAQFGQQLVANKRAAQSYADIYNRAVQQGYGGSTPAQADPYSYMDPVNTAGGIGDPRMGWNPIGTAATGGQPAQPEQVPTGFEDFLRGLMSGATGGLADLSSLPERLAAESARRQEEERQRWAGYTGTAGYYGAAAAENDRTEELLNQAIAQLQAEAAALEAKRQQALAAAEGDIAEEFGRQIEDVTNQIGGLQGDLDRYRTESAATIAANREGFDAATAAAGTITGEGLPMVAEDARYAKQEIVDGYDDAMVGLAEELMNLGIDSASKGALASDVMELRALALEESDLTSDNAKQMLKSAEQVARTAAELAGVTDEKELKMIEEAWSKQLTDAISGLMKQRGELETAREDAIRRAREEINGAFEEYGQYGSGLEYAEDITDKAMDVWFASSGLDELQRMEAEQLFQSLVGMGMRTPAEMRAYFDSLIEAGEMPPGSGVQEAIFTMSDVFFEAMGSWSTQQAAAIPNQDVTGGKLSQTGDRIRYVRSGEAPNNKGNRNNPTYQQRAQFMSKMNGYITQAFKVSSAGQWRDLAAGGGGQRSSNSDHYSGGALDFSGSREEIDRLFNWLKTQPWVSFAQIYTSGAAAGTLHVSGLLDGQTHSANDGHNHGEVAQTYEGGSGSAVGTGYSADGRKLS